MVKDQGGGSVTASRAYRHAFAVELSEIRTGRFTPVTMIPGDRIRQREREITAVSARPSRAKGKARRRKANKK